MNYRHPVKFAAVGLFALGSMVSCRLASDHFDASELSGEHSALEEKLRFYKVETSGKVRKSDLRPDGSVFRVGAGDLLEIEIVEVPFTKALTAVMPDGMLYYDTADPIHAVGMSIAELESALADALREQYSFPIVNINLREINSRTFTILGQVKNPAVYQMGQPTTVLDAIAAAGGTFTSFSGGRTLELADLRRSILVRNNKIVPVDFEALIESGDMSQNVYLKPGDYVYFPAAGTEKVYVMGAVRFPTAVGYSSRVTLVSALAAAKGPLPSAYQAGALLIRGSASNPRVARINLRGLTRGRHANFSLEPGDIIWVPKAPWEKLQEYATVAVNSAITSVAVRETSRWFQEEEVETTVNVTNTTTNSSENLTISTGPSSSSSSEALTLTPIVEESAAVFDSHALRSAFGGN